MWSTADICWLWLEDCRLSIEINIVSTAFRLENFPLLLITLLHHNLINLTDRTFISWCCYLLLLLLVLLCREQKMIMFYHKPICYRILFNALKLLLLGWFGIFIILPLIFKFSYPLQRGMLFLNFSKCPKFISVFIFNLNVNWWYNIVENLWLSVSYLTLRPDDCNGFK